MKWRILYINSKNKILIFKANKGCEGVDIDNKVYLQLKDGVMVTPGCKVLVRDLAVVLADNLLKENILNIEILTISKDNFDHIVVSILTIMEKIMKQYPKVKIFPIGGSEILVKIENSSKEQVKVFILLKLMLVCFVLFTGAGLALMNFHADVNMVEAHQKIYKMITGIEEKRPLLLQIPYSLGIGVGMAIFFNHVSPKKINNEPSPMEVEMFSYRKNIDEYMLKNEKNTEERL